MNCAETFALLVLLSVMGCLYLLIWENDYFSNLLTNSDNFTKKLIFVQCLAVIPFSWIYPIVVFVGFISRWVVVVPLVFFLFLANLCYKDSPDPP